MSSNWKKLSGADKWSDNLDKPNIDLRECIIHYGEMGQATSDAFKAGEVSKHVGKCLYEQSDLFSRLGMKQRNSYKVTTYLYGTTGRRPIQESNWIGYVAVATEDGKTKLGRRDIVIAWRGTVKAREWINDFRFGKVSAPEIFQGDGRVKIHQGWHSIYTTAADRIISSARNQVLEEVKCLIDGHRDEEISLTIVGHSLGGALATLNAVDIALNVIPTIAPTKDILVTAFAFASPRVGDSNFEQVYSSLGDKIRVLRIENENDIVPHYPSSKLFTCLGKHKGYSHVGEVLRIDTTKSPYLKEQVNIKRWHDMETYLHGVAGTHGSEGGFKLEVRRNIALVNKHTSGLKHQYDVSPTWWARRTRVSASGSTDHEPEVAGPSN